MAYNATEAIGLLAAALTTLCWVPQAIHTLRTRDTRGISLLTQTALTLGVALWLAYGALLGDRPIIFANAATLFFVAAILAMKLRFG